MNATTVDITADIAAFAEQVRGQLADLPADEVDDLTDGLEADMAEAFADSPGHELPEPASYALELRNAAGLPMQSKGRSSIRGAFTGLAQGWRDARTDINVSLRKSTALAGVLDFLVELRPAWWLIRAWVAYYAASIFLGFSAGGVIPGHPLGVIALVFFSVVSIQWGRARWLPRRGLPRLIALGNLIAVALLLPALWFVNGQSYFWGYDAAYSEGVYDQTGTGITLDGEPVSNVFAYGADGVLLKNVQLFDESGRPLAPVHDREVSTTCPDVAVDCSVGGGYVQVPSRLETGADVWNVFPLSIVRMVYVDDGVSMSPAPAPGSKAEQQKAPFLKVPAVLQPEKVAKGND